MKNKNNKRLRLFDITRDGKGISKNATNNAGGIKRFFVSYKDNIGKILSANIFMVLGNFPVIFLIAVFSGVTQKETFVPLHDLFQNLSAHLVDTPPTAHSMALFAVTGLQGSQLVPTAWTYVFYAIGALVLFTFGFVNVGTAYILRNIAKGEPVFVWSDFWYAVKRNWRQALPFGMLDIAINGILIINIYNMIAAGISGFLQSTLFWSNVVIFVIYFFMRFYIYVQMVTFKLTIWKIIKNSLIFSLLGFKRNILAFLGIVLGLLIEVAFIFSFGGGLISFAVAAPLLLLFSTFAYMKVYASYFKIKEIMIDPYNNDTEDDSGDDEPIMHDDVTENERLENIKRKNGLA
ncbi:MAG: DUF624 domain-containing protein [Clostridia bacterium]|nr:DUF624 domain-containing protein [Clostridia bacterium]